MVTGEYGAGQVIKTALTPLAPIPLTMGLRVIKTTFDNQIRATVRTEDTIAPSQVADRFKALGVINEILDIEHS
jgi:hypothetical protein|tara:strand:- start:447 stop:668 length:222 start_codon:yes stop_codon:yes gene_type:complete